MGTSSPSIGARRGWLAFSLALLALVGCGLRRAPAGRYDKDGVAFDHLAGWKVVKDVQKKARTIVMEGPRHAVVTISVFAPNLDVSLDTFINAAKKTRAEAVKKTFTVVGVNLGAEAAASSTTPTERSIAGKKVSGLEEHFTLDLLSVHVPHTAQYFMAKLGSRAVIFVGQVADKERGEVDAGIQKIFDSVAVGS